MTEWRKELLPDRHPLPSRFWEPQPDEESRFWEPQPDEEDLERMEREYEGSEEDDEPLPFE